MQSKDQLYYSLAVKGKSALPYLLELRSVVSSEAAGVLGSIHQRYTQGQKKDFKRSEIKQILVPTSPWLTVKRVIELIVNLPDLMVYLPDKDELTPQRTPRDILFTIFNTLDPSFFPDALKEIEDLKGLRIKNNRV